MTELLRGLPFFVALLLGAPLLAAPLLGAPLLAAEEETVPSGPTLPGTRPLQMEEPIDVVMVRGISLFADRELVKAKERRTAPWLEHPADSDQGKAARAEARQAVREMIGMPKELVPGNFFRGLTGLSAASRGGPWAGQENLIVFSCEWDAFEGVTGSGLISLPQRQLNGAQPDLPLVVVIPDADQTPEQLFGLKPGLTESEQVARRLALSGCAVLCPLLIDRECTWSGNPDIRWTNMPHREYLYRLSFELGLHPVGYEVAKVLAGIQGLKREHRESRLHTAVLGIGEGGLIALAAAAVDDESIGAVALQGYFGERDRVWEEPIYRNLYGQLKQFGDAEMAGLVAPRPLIIDPRPAPEVDGPTMPEGRAQIAAPGRITTPALDGVKREFERAQGYYRKGHAVDALTMIEGHDSDDPPLMMIANLLASGALSNFPFILQGADAPLPPYEELHAGQQEFFEHRMKSQVEELVRYSQRVLHSSDKVRAKLWEDVDMSSPEAFETSMDKYRQWVHESFIGKLPEPAAPLNPRSRKVIDEPTHVGYEVVLDVYPVEGSTESPTAEGPDWGVIAGGILLVPKDFKPGERRPVVVTQHGLEGTPMDTITTDESQRAWRAYKGFSTELVKRGFIVYAPQNPYKGGDEFRVIQRKSNPLGRSLFSYIIEQHRQTLGWLAALPWVDPERIAFYGLSYGGKTAVRVPPLLRTLQGSSVGDDGRSVGTGVNYGYCLSICSADFNDWIRKNVSWEDRYSYVYTGEYEIFEWNMGHVANYAELSWLMVPRPFMVERGHDDGVAPDEWVAWEYAKVRRTYGKLGIGERAEIEFFDGPHTINGVGTFRFLHTHLNWPQPVPD